MTRARQKIILTYRNFVTEIRKYVLKPVQPSRFLGRLPGHIEFCKYTSKQDIQRYNYKIHQDKSSKSNKKSQSMSEKKKGSIAKKVTGTIGTTKKKKKSVVTETAESDS